MNLEQLTIFGEDVISSVGYDEQEIIRNILHLHADGKMIDCDPTYSIGNFYSGWAVKPQYKFDKFPQVEGVVEATADKLPLENDSVKVVMFDPPFVMGSVGEGKEGIITSRFSYFKDFEELKSMYVGSMKEFYRILIDGGIVIFKCQDVVSSAKNHFTHCWVMNEALKIGFYPKDLFILIAKNRLNDGRKQQHARKYHSYFWVFSKTNCKVNYI